MGLCPVGLETAPFASLPLSLPALSVTCTTGRTGHDRHDRRDRAGHARVISRPAPRREYGAGVVYAARLTVLGSLNMDISVTVPALPVPGATVLGGAAAFAPGGKGANQAVAAAPLAEDAGVTVAVVGCTGDDEFGRTLRAALRAEGIDDGAVRAVAGVPTGIAMITVDRAGENMITVAPGANRELTAADVTELVGDSRRSAEPERAVAG